MDSAPFMTRTDMTRGWPVERFIVIVGPVPTFGVRAYQTWLRRSTPVTWLVGPAAEVHVVSLVSLRLS